MPLSKTMPEVRANIKPQLKLKAYAVLEDCENTGGIVFARHSIVALRRGAAEFGDGDTSGWRANRAQWADKYAETEDVPASLAIKYGWRFECHGCGDIICEDSLDVKRLSPSGVIGPVNHGNVYCCEACVEEANKRKERAERAKQVYSAMFSDMVLRRLPDAVITGTHVYAPERHKRPTLEQCIIYFRFPGQKIGDAVFRYDLHGGWRQIGPSAPHFTCCIGDKQAFEDYAEFAKHLVATEAYPS